MATIRDLDYGDIDSVAKLHAAQGWGVPSVATWRHIFEANPAVNPAKDCLGWALEHDNHVVGYLLNVRQRYAFRGKNLEAAAAASLIVSPEHSVHSLKLLNRFRQQENIDVFLTNTAAPVTSELLRFLKFRKIPQESYQTNLFWILRSQPFLNSAIRKRYPKPALASTISYAGAPMLSTALCLRRTVRGRRFRSDNIGLESNIHIAEIELSCKFDAFWELMRQRSNRMMAVRDSNSMKWHFKEFRDPKCRLLGATRNDQLVGYAVILRRDNKALELSRAKLADMVVVNDEPRIVTGLFKMAVKCATDDGAAMLEVEGLPNSIREPLRGLSPFTIAHQKCPFWFWTPKKSTLNSLSSVDSWYAGLYDGDGSL